VIALVMRSMNETDAFGFGQWQQSHVSQSILSLPWSLPIDSSQNPVVFRDAAASQDAAPTPSQDPSRSNATNENRHKLVFGPITWLSMALDVKEWDRNMSARSELAAYVEAGRRHWAGIRARIEVNKQICSLVPRDQTREQTKEHIAHGRGERRVSGEPPGFAGLLQSALRRAYADPWLDLCHSHLLGCATEAMWLNAIVPALAELLPQVLQPYEHAWSHLSFERARHAWTEAIALVQPAVSSEQTSVQAIANASMAVERFFFGDMLAKRPFNAPMIEPVVPPVAKLA
jgi:hypothetical protein